MPDFTTNLDLDLRYFGSLQPMRSTLVDNFTKIDAAVAALPAKSATVVANATDAASVITQLNALLVALRATGVIHT
jgi:hypothetical protein